MILTDAHAHFYPHYQLDEFISSAFKNFIAAERTLGESDTTFLLFLTEVSASNHFSEIKTSKRSTARWFSEKTEEACSFQLFHSDYHNRGMIVISGEQLVTKEKIEVLAIGYSNDIQSGLTLKTTVSSVLDLGGIAIVPWGVGKWLGRRGKIIEELRATNTNPLLFLGDNGSRPTFWPESRFKGGERALPPRLLSGTDPLPLEKEERRVGTFGTRIPGNLDPLKPFHSLKQILCAPETIISDFGSLQSPLCFFKQQLALRIAR